MWNFDASGKHVRVAGHGVDRDDVAAFRPSARASASRRNSPSGTSQRSARGDAWPFFFPPGLQEIDQLDWLIHAASATFARKVSLPSASARRACSAPYGRSRRRPARAWPARTRDLRSCSAARSCNRAAGRGDPADCRRWPRAERRYPGPSPSKRASPWCRDAAD